MPNRTSIQHMNIGCRQKKCGPVSTLLCNSWAIAALLASLIWPDPVASLEFQCQLPGDVRYLHVDIPGEGRLCEVSVSHEYNGERLVKWHARSDTMFCSAKAYELRGKYENLWGYTCETWPDRDGIDTLSLSQRAILDALLKQSIDKAAASIPPDSINSVKAIASTPLDEHPGKLAFQFFTSSGNYTQVVDDRGSEWSVLVTINDLENHIDSGAVVETALIHAIDDNATLEIHTHHFDENQQSCQGSQSISVTDKSSLLSRNPHRYYCETTAGDR